MDIRQLVQVEIAVLYVLSSAEVQLMNIHKTIDFHAKHLFPVLREQVAGIEEAFATSLLQKNETIWSKLNATVSKEAEETIRDKQGDSGTRRETHSMLDSETFVQNIAQRIVEGSNVVNSFATHSKIHVHKAIDDFPITTNGAKTVAELSDRVKDVARRQNKAPTHTLTRPNHAVIDYDNVLATHAVVTIAT